MSKYNKEKKTEKVTNHMGAKAFKQGSEIELIGILLTSFAEDSYYRKNTETLVRLKELIDSCDPEFVAKALIFARTKFGMRSISHVGASILAPYAKGTEWADSFYDKIIYRLDDMLEILSYHKAQGNVRTNKKSKGKIKITHSMRRGFAKAFGRFDEYAISKYKGDGKDLKLIDALNLIRPVPTECNMIALKKLKEGTLSSAAEGMETWEALLTKAGQEGKTDAEKAKNKKAVWVKLVSEKKIKLFAVLKNLRNIMEQAPEAVEGALEILTDEKQIKKSLILPFRYLTAYTEIEKLKKEDGFEKDTDNTAKVLKAIEKAVLISIENIPVLNGKTLILTDNSGSMRGDGGGESLVSRMSSTTTAHIANLFAVLYWTRCDNTMIGVFGDNLEHPKLNREKSIFDNFKVIDKVGDGIGGGTEAGIYTMFRKMIKEKIMCDTIVIFSDCQIGDKNVWYGRTTSERQGDFDAVFKEYKKINPNFRVYSIDLKNYGTTVFDGSVIKMSGWSEKIFSIMKMAEQDKEAMLNEILKIELKKEDAILESNGQQ